MVPKEVTDSEVYERRIYLVECMRGNDLVKNIEQKNCDNYCLAEKINERKIKFLRICNTQSIRWRQGIN
jgi:hypothetical protein